MAGTLFGLSLSQQVDLNGNPLIGATLSIFQAGTSTPVSVYTDYALTDPAPNPLVTDGYGRIPQFWLDDGVYRARLLKANGESIFDEPYVPALGASSGGGGGGGGVNVDAIFNTGDIMWALNASQRSGFIRLNGKTIGSASSGANERANSDCQDLFYFKWSNFTDADCPVLGGRGASAAADWAANKQIATFDMRGRGAFGLDTMGNSAAGVLTGGTTNAAKTGAQEVALVVNEMPVHKHTILLNDPGHKHGVIINDPPTRVGKSTTSVGGSATVDVPTNVKELILDTQTVATGIIGDSVNNGGGLPHNNVPPCVLGSWYMKL